MELTEVTPASPVVSWTARVLVNLLVEAAVTPVAAVLVDSHV